MKTLKRGDIAICQHFDFFPEYNGEECTVLDGLEMRPTGFSDTLETREILRYRAQMSDGRILGPLAHQLRPRPEPDEKHAANDEQELPDLLAA